MADPASWQGVREPEREVLDGTYVRLEPLAARQEDDLYRIATAPGADDRFRYLFDHPPATRAAFHAWMEKSQTSADPLYFAAIDQASGRAEGRQALMRIVPAMA